VSRAIAATAVAVLAAGCESSGDVDGPDTLTVLAAASLSRAFPDIGREFSEVSPGTVVRFSFAGTDALAAQIEQGAPADVFAGAATAYGDRLATAGLVGPVRPFCTNAIVLITPAGDTDTVGSPADLASPGVSIVVSAPTVPAGAYAREAIAGLEEAYGPGFAARVLANVVSEELDVESVLAKVRLREADAGFVYATDAAAASGDVRTVALPPAARVTAVYPIAPVASSRHPEEARDFVAFVLGPSGQRILSDAGFGAPA